MKYSLSEDTWNQEELGAIQKVIDSNRYTMGAHVQAFEKKFAEKMGVKHAVMVNSGSSANLLAIAALVYSGKLPRGSQVIVPAVSWSTTYAPLEQFGMKLRFADIDADTLNISIRSLKEAVTADTRMLFAVNLLGNPNEWEQLQSFCNEKNILIAEDNCESMGAVYEGKALGTFGLIGTYSSFYSHHICTMEGGVAVTNDDLLYEYMLAIRAHGWTRNLPEKSLLHQRSGDSFYEKFHFIVPGFNLRPLEMEAAIGCAQLDKLDEMIAARRKNAAYFQKKMTNFPEIRLQKEVGHSSWFGFSLVLQGTLAAKRDALVRFLEEHEIEVRPIVAGNFTRNPVIRFMDCEMPVPLTNADEIHEHGFYIGNYSRNSTEEIDYFIDTLQSFLAKG